MNRSRSISVSPDTHAIIKRYACFAGMSSKCAVEYAVNHCLVTEISDYLRDVDGAVTVNNQPEVDINLPPCAYD